MSGASYRRGSLAISRQFCRDRGCIGCVRCSETRPEPRPASWGAKAANRADDFASGFVGWCIATGRSVPGADDLAAAIRDNTGCGAKTANAVAARVLGAL